MREAQVMKRQAKRAVREDSGETAGGSSADGAGVEETTEAAEPVPPAGGELAPDAQPAEPDEEELVRRLAALVFASPEPLSANRLAELCGRPGEARLKSALAALGARLAASGLPIELREIAGGYQFLTSSTVAPTVALLAEERKTERISGAALETLAIVAYRQPVTKAEIEAIRGVQAGPILRTLVDRGLVKVTGRADQPGHALEYGTTREFLERFGLAKLADLPRDGELARD